MDGKQKRVVAALGGKGEKERFHGVRKGKKLSES